MNPQFAGALAYLGGAVSGLILLLVEKQDRFVRFHAMQSTITFLLVLVAHLALSGLPWVGPILRIPFVVAVIVLWVFLMYQAFSGNRYKLPYVGDFAEHQLK